MNDDTIKTDKDMHSGFADAANGPAHPSEAPLTEIIRRFDVYVDMDEHSTVAKGTSIATSALNGCIAGYIENPDGNIFFHYSPARLAKINEVIERHVTKDTKSVHLMMPGDENDDPIFYYPTDFLGDDIDFILGKGITPQLHCYSDDQNFEERYEGTAWIDKSGTLFVENEQVYSPQEKPDASAKPKL